MRLAFGAVLLTAQLATAQTPPPAILETPVLARTIERGEVLQVSDFELQRVSASAARGALRPTEAADKEALRRLMAGTAVRSGDVTTPQLVRRGESVVLSVRAGALSITTAARALSGGGAGDAVRVVSLDTNRTLPAIVEGRGHVRVVGIGE